MAYAQPTATGLWIDTIADCKLVVRDVLSGRRPRSVGRFGPNSRSPEPGDVYVLPDGVLKRWTDPLSDVWGPSSTRQNGAITYCPPRKDIPSPRKDIPSHSFSMRKQRCTVNVLDCNGQSTRWLVVSYVWHEDSMNKAKLLSPSNQLHAGTSLAATPLQSHLPSTSAPQETTDSLSAAKKRPSPKLYTSTSPAASYSTEISISDSETLVAFSPVGAPTSHHLPGIEQLTLIGQALLNDHRLPPISYWIESWNDVHQHPGP
ncbi:hypothetical protein BKA62DRAFT_704518 [Auriculariales sp. MPI-PUGE-AT-0066]|nr:hypothetical protein BKA62DRAFT_704518 [Auriculariales sp. MPI-PUGE-AT-0066]